MMIIIISRLTQSNAISKTHKQIVKLFDMTDANIPTEVGGQADRQTDKT